MGLHLFLSPHLDDAVLSCGGMIHRLARSGERVIVLTAMAGDPQPPLVDSPALNAFKARWLPGEQPIARRRAEDVQAAQMLGAQSYHMALAESIFRKTICGAGDWIALYPTLDSPLEAINEADEARLFLFETRPAFGDLTTIYAPLCADAHVDHRLVRDWALILAGPNDAPALKLYEEYPQARVKAALQQAQTFYQRQLPALTLESEVVALAPEDVDARLRAMACYRSHLHVLWNTREEMERLTREYLILVGDGTPAERCWHVVR